MTNANTNSTDYSLELRFDLNQLSDSLAYSFLHPNGKTKPVERAGLRASTFQFKYGDQISTLIEGRIESDKALVITNLDCTFVFVENSKEVIPNRFLSPFFEEAAALTLKSSLGDWREGFPFHVKGKIENTKMGPAQEFRIRQQVTPDSPGVKAKNGQWATTGLLSITYELDGESQSRLFKFDPETSSGPGNN